MSDDTRPPQHPALGVLDVIDARLAHERACLAVAGGGAPLCGGADPHGPVKQHEGAVVALTRLHAALGDKPDRLPEQVAEEVLEHWRHEHRARSGTAWTAYVNGGSRALTEALGDLARPETGPTPAEAAATVVEVPDVSVGTDAVPPLGAPPASRRPGRRVLSAVGLAAVLGAVLLSRAAGAPDASVLTTVVALAALVLASAALATFVPSTGPLRRLELGCGPCAAAGGMLAAAAAWMAVSDPTQMGSASLAFGLGGIALVQRLSTPATCPTPTGALGRPTTQVPGERLDESSPEAPTRSSAER